MIIFSGRIVKLILPGASIAGEEQNDSQSIIYHLWLATHGDQRKRNSGTSRVTGSAKGNALLHGPRRASTTARQMRFRTGQNEIRAAIWNARGPPEPNV
jgi:hypothetical protein